MTPPPPQTPGPVPPRRQWRRVVLVLSLAGIGALGWHSYTGQRAERQLREAGFEVDSDPWLGARVWAAARNDWRLVFNSAIWKSRPTECKLDGAKVGELRNFDAVAPALRRVNPKEIVVGNYHALQNVDGLKGLTGLQTLFLTDCDTLQNVDGLKELAGLRMLGLAGCTALRNVDVLEGLPGLQTLFLNSCSKISASALRDLRAALPNTNITFPDGSKSPPP